MGKITTVRAALAGALLGALCGFSATGSALAQQVDEVPALPPEPEEEWRPIAPENLVLLDTEKGRITIELNPDFAPTHSERMRELIRSGALDGKAFYRVIDGFVAQAGLQDEEEIAKWAPLAEENDRPYGGEGFVPLGNPDLFAPDVGHVKGFPVGRNQLLLQEWLLHCPGAVAMARDTGPDTGATEFYIVLDAQRYLDRNLTIFGRVIDGMAVAQALKRGDRDVENGVIQAPETGDRILFARLAADIPALDRPMWEAMVTDSDGFAAFKRSKRTRDDEFFYRKPPEVLDICSFSAPVRQLSAQ